MDDAGMTPIRRFAKDTLLSVGIGVPFCFVLLLAAMVFGTPIIAFVEVGCAVVKKAMFG